MYIIFGINTTCDISKLSQISLAWRLVKLRITILKYHLWYLCQISLQIMLLPIRTSVILAGKRGSRRHSTTSFSENVEVAETRYQMLEVLPPSLKVTVLTFLVKNGKMKLSWESIFWEYAKNLSSFQSNLVLVVVLVLESKGLYHPKIYSKCNIFYYQDLTVFSTQ